MSDFEDSISKYRKGLIKAEQEMQLSYDKAVMALSGGALGISFTFLKEVVGKATIVHSFWLLAAWICWGTSATSTLMSFYTSTRALRRAILQTDEKLVYLELVGGWSTRLTKILNFSGGFLFLAGLVSIVIFVAYNLH
jgi:hypothetical protein